MLKKSLLAISVFSQILLVSFMGVYIYTNQSKPEVIEDLFTSTSPQVEDRVTPVFSVPFTAYIEAKGVVLPSSGYLHVSNPLEGQVRGVYVAPGDWVKEESPLFKLCDNEIYVEIKEREAKLARSVATLNFMKKGPSEFTLLGKRKEIEEVEIKRACGEKEAEIFHTLLNKTAISVVEHDEKQLFLQITEKELERVTAEYDGLKAGMSPEEELIYVNDVEEKKATLKLSTLKLENSLITSPINGMVVAVDVAAGEFLKEKGLKGVTIVKTNPLMVKVCISEDEAYKIRLGQKLRAIAIHPSNPSMHFVLDYVSYNPRMSVYTNGERKLELLFSFQKGDHPIYLEQTLKVYVETSKPADLSFLHYQYY